MSVIPGHFARVSSLMASQVALGHLTRTNFALFRAQGQAATGRAIGAYSDDAVKAAAIAVMDDRLERSAQTSRNLDHATSSLNVLDSGLSDISDLILEAKSIASAQVNVGSTGAEREQQAIVVNSLLQNLFNLVNQQGVAGSVFGGSTPGLRPVETMLGGYRYIAQGQGLVTDLGLGAAAPITIGPEGSVGGVSTRVRGNVDLDPDLTPDTRITDIAGARGVGVALGTIEMSIDGGPRLSIDLSAADTVGDVARVIQAAIQDHEAANSVTILGPGGVGVSGESLAVDLAPATAGGPAIQFFDPSGQTAAADLGIAGTFTPTAEIGQPTGPRLTWRTPVSVLAGLTDDLGSIQISSLGQNRILDLSGARTLGDLRNLIEGTGLGLRVQINEDGTGIDVLNEVAAGRDHALSISEVEGNNLTATMLGIRTMTAGTPMADFNDGRGVQLVDGVVNPVTGQPDPALNVDFTITLGDTAGTEIDVDLRPQDVLTVQTLIDRINSQAAAAGVAVPADFQAALSDGPNGIALVQNAAFTGSISVLEQNNSPAAGQIGLLNGVYDTATGTFRAEDRAKVRVDNLFTTLTDLRDALENNDTAGITLAGGKLEEFVSRVAETRALVGGYARRVDDAAGRQQDQDVLDEKIRSNVRDLDYAEAAVRLSLLQTQYQAGLQTTAMLQGQSLLNYL
ncbi:MAG: hypothetical protein IT437_05670 [Phycisphaerales bacterium]|nr:hypothetical protein [Phycisphaerales bacterium]